MLSSWWVGNKLWRNFYEINPWRGPLETPLNRFIFWEQAKVLEGHKETNLLNHMIQRSHFYITEPFSCQTLPTCSQGTHSVVNAEQVQSVKTVSKGVSQLDIVRKAGQPKSIVRSLCQLNPFRRKRLDSEILCDVTKKCYVNLVSPFEIWTNLLFRSHCIRENCVNPRSNLRSNLH